MGGDSMRDDVKRKAEGGLVFLLYIVAHGLACVLGYLFYMVLSYIFRGRGDDGIGLLHLIVLYVVHSFANLFVAAGLDYVFNLSRRLNVFLVAFLSHLVLIASLLFLVFWSSNWDFEMLFCLGILVLIYFTLPLGVSFFIMNLIVKALDYFFGPEEKAVAKGKVE
jgi:hypothetical protein